MPTKPLKFEEAMQRLEEIIDAMESGELSLEESIKQYTEAAKLSKQCEEQLGNFSKKIELLTKKDGEIIWDENALTS